MTFRVTALLLALLAATGAARAQSPGTPIDSTSAVDEALRSFLIEHLDRMDPGLEDADSSVDAKVRYATASVRLVDSRAPMDFVFVVGDMFCGTGGCTTLVIDRASGTPRIVSEINLMRTPISVLRTTSHGWHDLRARSVGGGKLVADWATYRYDGHEYVLSRDAPTHAARDSGQVVFTDATTLHLLYRCRRPTVGEERRDCSLRDVP